MNRRRFLGLAAAAPLAVLGTRVPEPAQAATVAPDISDARAEFDALDAEFRRGLKTWDEFRETECGSDPYGALAERAAWNPADMSMERMREVSRRELGLPLDRPSTDAEIAAMARRDRERGA